jgi:hypothetical protein
MTAIDRSLRRRRALRRLRGGFTSRLDEVAAHVEHVHVLLEWKGVGRSLQAYCAALAALLAAIEAMGLEDGDDLCAFDAERALGNLDMLAAILGKGLPADARAAVAELRAVLATAETTIAA